MDKAVKTYRVDDVCRNTDMKNLNEITDLLIAGGHKVMWAVSPLVHNMFDANDPVKSQRVFPEVLNAYSDVRHFYEVDAMEIPVIREGVDVAAHGILHLDHRLIHESVQELSILVSCSLLKCKKFVPPFNKWTKSMEIICQQNGIELVKFESGWKSMEFNECNPSHNLWYMHSREWSYKKVIDWHVSANV